MRPIKFRAYIKSEKLMTEVIRLDYLFENHICIDVIIPGKGRYWNNLNPDDYELIQFTGFVDENGSEIWEGDIIIVDGVDFYEKVIFENGAFVLWSDKDHISRLDGAIAKGLKVVGNIYETPEIKCGIVNKTKIMKPKLKWEISYYDYNGEYQKHIITNDCAQAAIAKLHDCKTLIEVVQIKTKI